MRQIIYDVAMTLDGFICDLDGTCDGFLPEGDHVSDYLERLQQYDTVLMGRKTYEFGYQFGLKPGERAYAHMEHFIFSNTLSLVSDQIHIVERDRFDLVKQLKQADGKAIYLCGGGAFAGALLQRQLIDQLVVKLNPVIFGAGIKAFGDCSKAVRLELTDFKRYDNGVVLQRYDVVYGA